MNVGALGLCEHFQLSLWITWLKEAHSFFVNKQTVRFVGLALVTEIFSFWGVTLCSAVKIHEHFGNICLHLVEIMNSFKSYVYWTVHHLDSWIKIDQLDVTCFIISLFNAQHVSNVNTSILRSLRNICWVISWVVLLWYDVCGLAGVVWYPDAGWSSASACVQIPHNVTQWSLHPDTTPPQPNHNVTPTHIKPEQYNPCNNLTSKSQAPEDGCINIRNMLSIK